MSKLIQRAIVPSLLLTAGIASLVYGSLFHAATVVEEQEVEESVPLPSPFGPPGAAGAPFGETGMPPFLPPERLVAKVKRKIVSEKVTAEAVLVREVTFGGVVRLANGELKRTYSGKAPSLCPT
jgi:hypothetical protein